jgi:ceramide galactosyltransferase
MPQLEFISLGQLLSSADPLATTGRVPSLTTEDADLYDNYAATLLYYASLQRPMLSALLDDFEEDRPALVIVDRYAFAGFAACQKLGIPYVVHSPSLLMDMDTPPAYIPAPFSSFSMHVRGASISKFCVWGFPHIWRVQTPSVLARCQNSFHRLRFRLAMVQVFREVNRVRVEGGLSEIQSKDDLFGHQLVLVSSLIGLDEPRPMAPQFQLVGLLAPTTLSPSKRLSGDFETWISRDTAKPLVLVSFARDTPLSPELVALLLSGLEHIGARLVWKISLEEQAAFDLGERPRDSVFFLRDDDATTDESLVLQHAPVSLLITAGTHYSVLQALAVGVPVLGIPFTAEQVR